MVRGYDVQFGLRRAGERIVFRAREYAYDLNEAVLQAYYKLHLSYPDASDTHVLSVGPAEELTRVYAQRMVMDALKEKQHG